MKKPSFIVASPEEIAEGRVTDVYFVRTREILEHEGIRKKVRAEIFVKSLPRNWPWGIFAGLGEVLTLMEGHPVNIRAIPEGDFFYENFPVFEIEGDYLDFGIFETAILGLLCQASGIATSAARCVKLADGRPVYSFGARRMHPVLAPMVERNAYVGGCSGVAAVKSAEVLGIEPTGTIPHALVILMGDSVGATRAFDEVIDPAVTRVALVDTFGDEKFETLAVAEELGRKLAAVRLDTTSSRRGDFLRILQEVRWELDLRGRKDVKLIASGGISEREVVRLNQVVDAYGIGTAISGGPTVDYSLDIVEVEGRPTAKRGKMSGAKELFRCSGCLKDLVLPIGSAAPVCGFCGTGTHAAMSTVMEGGKIISPEPAPGQIRKEVLKTLERLDVEPS